MSEFSTKRNLLLEHLERAPHGSYLLIVCDPERAEMLASLVRVARPDLKVEVESPCKPGKIQSNGGIV